MQITTIPFQPLPQDFYQMAADFSDRHTDSTVQMWWAALHAKKEKKERK